MEAINDIRRSARAFDWLGAELADDFEGFGEMTSPGRLAIPKRLISADINDKFNGRGRLELIGSNGSVVRKVVAFFSGHFAPEGARIDSAVLCENED